MEEWRRQFRNQLVEMHGDPQVTGMDLRTVSSFGECVAEAVGPELERQGVRHPEMSVLTFAALRACHYISAAHNLAGAANLRAGHGRWITPAAEAEISAQEAAAIQHLTDAAEFMPAVRSCVGLLGANEVSAVQYLTARLNGLTPPPPDWVD